MPLHFSQIIIFIGKVRQRIHKVSYEDFKDLYYNAWKQGCKGITTFRAAGKRYGVLNEVKAPEANAEACYIDPETGSKSCE